MDSLDSIWDDPVDEAPAHPQSSSSSHQPLFLADSDEETSRQPPPKNVPDVDIDAMFAEVEAEDDPFSFKPLTSNLNTEALTREAEARHKKAMPSLTPHAIMSSSPPRDPGNDQTSKQAGQKSKEGIKEKRKPVRLDEGRLLGPNGFPKLIKDTKNFKVKGKGYEATDLNRLLQVYGYWTHEMFPRTTFHDTVQRVEKLCHSKRLHVALSVWRDEVHGLVNGRKPEDDGVIDLTEDPRGDPTLQSGSSRASSPVSNGAAYASSSSRPPSHPPSSASEVDDDDFDIDAIIREEEERLAKERDSSGSTKMTSTTGGQINIVANDDDADMWEALDSMQGAAATVHPKAGKTDEDEAMWDEIDVLQDAAKPAHLPLVRDEDEDMWDVLREMENDDSERKRQSPPVARDPDDDWDSVYV